MPDTDVRMPEFGYVEPSLAVTLAAAIGGETDMRTQSVGHYTAFLALSGVRCDEFGSQGGGTSLQPLVARELHVEVGVTTPTEWPRGWFGFCYAIMSRGKVA